ncbi:hypothetical protein [Arenicella sp. 4NH20-0111]|uniref:hypothetical protein n=1 Tax=Arenicella sp. 4NH20-0111 TaxID=3127648 RepID=UPI003341FD9A
MKKISFQIFFACVLGVCMLPKAATAGQWTAWFPAHVVYIHSNEHIYFQLNPTTSHSNPDGCATQGWYIVKPDNKIADRIYKMLLTSKASGKKVRVYLSGCYDNKPLVHHMMLWN